MSKRAKTFIIAEAGVNHNGSVSIAKKLIDEAKKAGADAVKFQTFKAERLVSIGAKKADYQKKTTSAKESQYVMLKKLELGDEDFRFLMGYARKKNIVFLSSPFDEGSVDLLEKLGITMFKIPSGEITNHPFLRHVARKRKPLIVSTGMSTLGEVEEAVDVICSVGNKKITLLHCVSEYPAPFDEINLSAMLTMKQAFHHPVGYSDHTTGIEIAIAAAALGAAVIEKHFTLNRDMEGPDHKASLEPDELQQMVRSIRNVEKAIGDGVKRPTVCEMKNLPIIRKSIVASKTIKRGDLFTLENLAVKRPGGGISPKSWNEVIGKSAKKDFIVDEQIEL